MDTHTPRKWSTRLGIGGIALLACIAVALCGLAFSPRAAHAAVGDYGTLEDGTYMISSYYASTQGYTCYWDVADGGKSDGTKVQSWQGAGSGDERWRITTDSDGYSTIVNAQSGKALDVPGGTFNDLEQLQIYTKNGGKAQKWKIIEEEHGYKIAWAADERYVIDLAYSSTDNGAMVILGGSHGGDNQRWTFKRCTEDALNVSDEQTELFDTSVYLTDYHSTTPVLESIPDGWSVESIGQRGWIVNYDGGEYYAGGNAVIKARYDKIGKVNGEWVSIRLTLSSFKGDGPSAAEGNTCLYICNRLDFAYYGLRQCDLAIEVFYSDSGQSIPLEGAFCGFGSLNGKQGVGVEGVQYLTSNDHKSYVLTTNNLKKRGDGSWVGDSEDGWVDDLGDPTYNKNSIAYGIVDAVPKFHFYNEGSNRGSYMSISFSPLTAAIPPSPTKSATITG